MFRPSSLSEGSGQLSPELGAIFAEQEQAQATNRFELEEAAQAPGHLPGYDPGSQLEIVPGGFTPFQTPTERGLQGGPGDNISRLADPDLTVG